MKDSSKSEINETYRGGTTKASTSLSKSVVYGCRSSGELTEGGCWYPMSGRQVTYVEQTVQPTLFLGKGSMFWSIFQRAFLLIERRYPIGREQNSFVFSSSFMRRRLVPSMSLEDAVDLFCGRDGNGYPMMVPLAHYCSHQRAPCKQTEVLLHQGA